MPRGSQFECVSQSVILLSPFGFRQYCLLSVVLRYTLFGGFIQAFKSLSCDLPPNLRIGLLLVGWIIVVAIMVKRFYNDNTYWLTSTYKNLRANHPVFGDEAFRIFKQQLKEEAKNKKTTSKNINRISAKRGSNDKTQSSISTSNSNGSADSLIYISDGSDVEIIDFSDDEIIEVEVNKIETTIKADNQEKLLALASEVIHKRDSKKKNIFILDEADDAFDDDECFLDDEATQAEANNSMDDFIVDDDLEYEYHTNKNHSRYLKSVAHLVGGNSKFVFKDVHNNNTDVYSQAVAPDPGYQNDSFCVSNDEIIYASSSGEDSFKFLSPEPKLKKSNQESKLTSTPKINSRKIYKRVITNPDD